MTTGTMTSGGTLTPTLRAVARQILLRAAARPTLPRAGAALVALLLAHPVAAQSPQFPAPQFPAPQFPAQPVSQPASAVTVAAPPLAALMGAVPTRPITASRDGDLWHLRSALNVAALMCGQHVQQATLIDNYNALLRTHRTLLAKAVESVLTRFRTQDKRRWQALYDTHMTKLYNGYSGTHSRDTFCAAAFVIAQDAVALDAAGLSERATVFLTQLNQAASLP
jgi:hypothetical protein